MPRLTSLVPPIAAIATLAAAAACSTPSAQSPASAPSSAPAATAATDTPTEYDLYFLGGQSNMDGYGYVADLPGDDPGASANVMIFLGTTDEDGGTVGGAGLWAPLGPGFGTGVASNGETNARSDRFGPELSFGRALAASDPTRKIALIKYVRGGTGLVDGVSGYGSWDPDYADGNGLNQYDHALTTIRNATRTRDIDGDGTPDRLTPAGIIWMQGEADAFDNLDAATNYDRNLARLMDLLRAALHADDLPVVIGRIVDSGDTAETRVMAYSPEVQAAQQRYVDTDTCAALVSVTQDFAFLPDGWHYESQEYIRLGEAFAAAVAELEGTCGVGE